MNPQISIIVPVYNAEKHLNRCIQSVINQTFADWELILINDGSTDGSLALLNNWKLQDDRINVISKENGGVSAARNTGLAKAQGVYITFLDADDAIEADYLSTLSKCDDNVDIVIAGAKIVSTNQPTNTCAPDKNSIIQSKYEMGVLVNDYSDCCYIRAPWAKLFKKQLLDHNHIRFDGKIHYAEDMLFTMDCLLAASTVKCISYSGYTYYAELYTGKYKVSTTDIIHSTNTALKIINRFSAIGVNMNKVTEITKTLNHGALYSRLSILDKNSRRKEILATVFNGYWKVAPGSNLMQQLKKWVEIIKLW